MKIYHYDRLTGELSGTGTADLDPIEGLPLVPAHATISKPPAASAGFVNVFQVLSGIWNQAEDNRGPIFSKVDGAESVQTDLGPISDIMTKQKPPSTEHSWDGVKGAWIIDPAKVKASKITAIRAAYDTDIAAIVGGYPQTEIDTWYVQETEARAFTLDNTAPTPFLSAQATARGITVAALATLIVTRADVYKAAVAAALGKRQAAELLA